MKHLKIILICLIALFTLGTFCMNVDMYINRVKPAKFRKHLPSNIYTDTYKRSTLIWNEDDEAIPPVGGLCRVDFIEGNTVYLLPVEDLGVKPEYTLEIISQDSVKIKCDNTVYKCHMKDIQNVLLKDNL